MTSLIEVTDLVENPTARVPVSLCLDTSSSMAGAPMNELNAGVRSFYKAIEGDEIARWSAEISVVTFGPANLARGFHTVAENGEPPRLSANGMTPMGEAVQMALDSLDARKAEYQAYGVDYYQPWLVVMTDGQPNGSAVLLESQITRVVKMVESRKLTVFPIGIGRDADMQVLARFSPGRTPLRLQGLKFSEFFMWLSASVGRVSQSSPGDSVPLDVDGIKGWGEL